MYYYLLYNKPDIKKLPSSVEEFRKQYKMDRRRNGAFSRAKSVDDFQSSHSSFLLVGAKFIRFQHILNPPA